MPLPTVLITGCTHGSLGYALAREFAAQNYHVFATTRKIESMGDLGTVPNVTLLSLDVSSPESLRAAHEAVSKETGGKLDILYHNAGYRSLAMAIETLPEEASRMLNVNFLSIIEMNRIFADLLIASKGKILFSGSVAGFTPNPTQSVYCASKAALDLYAQTLRIEMRPFGVRVVFVQTAVVHSKMSVERIDLPEGSVYAALQDKFNEAWNKNTGAAMTSEAYAKTVVGKVLRTNPPEVIWCGSGAFTVWLIEWLGVQWAYPWVFGSMFGLSSFVPRLKSD